MAFLVMGRRLGSGVRDLGSSLSSKLFTLACDPGLMEGFPGQSQPITQGKHLKPGRADLESLIACAVSGEASASFRCCHKTLVTEDTSFFSGWHSLMAGYLSPSGL